MDVCIPTFETALLRFSLFSFFFYFGATLWRGHFASAPERERERTLHSQVFYIESLYLICTRELLSLALYLSSAHWLYKRTYIATCSLYLYIACIHVYTRVFAIVRSLILSFPLSLPLSFLERKSATCIPPDISFLFLRPIKCLPSSARNYPSLPFVFSFLGSLSLSRSSMNQLGLVINAPIHQIPTHPYFLVLVFTIDAFL